MGSSRILPPTLVWILPVLIGVLWLDGVEGRQYFPRPRYCKSSDTWFRHRRRYLYNYEAAVDTGIPGTSDRTAGYVLSCDVEVFVPRKCESTIELKGCKLKERGEDGRLSLSPKSSQLAMDLERYEVYVQMDRGRVLDHQMIVDQSEPTYVINIKRAIVSQFQLYILKPEEYDSHVQQVDLFGTCPTRYVFSKDGVTTQRDITKCHVPQVFRRLHSHLSLVRQIDSAILSKPVDELIYPFESNVECTYTIGDKRTIDRSVCAQTQTFKPFTINGELRATPSANITQTLTRMSMSKVSRREAVISRGLEGRKLVGLSMELTEPDTPEVTSADLFTQLQGLLATYTKESDALPPERFRQLVDMLRGASDVILTEVLETLLTCRGPGGCTLDEETVKLPPDLVQKLRETMFADGLLSCATEPCVSTYIIGLQRGLVNKFQGELTLFNMGLFYQPSPGVLGHMMNLCKSRPGSSCWLTLGTFVNKLAKEVEDIEDKKSKKATGTAIRDVLQNLRAVLGDSCRADLVSSKTPDEHHETVSSLLVTLKTLGNAGDSIQKYHDDIIMTGKELVPAILQCVENSHLPLKVSRAAFLVLRKLEPRQEIRTSLVNVLGDVTRHLSLRTEAFDLLFRHDHVTTVRTLLKAAQTEKLESLQLYMVTRIGHLLESNSPKTANLRKLWREAMKQESKPLPLLESFKGRGSQYAEISRYISLPISGIPAGVELGISVVFDPSSVLPSAVQLAFQATLGNRTLLLFEVGLDIQGLENIGRQLLGKDLNIRKDGPGATMAKIMQAALPKPGSPPGFFLKDQKVVESLKKLFTKVNMPTGDLPQAQFQLRLFGNDVGYVHLEDLIMMVKQGTRGDDKGPSKLMSLVQQLAQGLSLFVGKAVKLVEVEKVIPTVGGFPWHANVQGTMVASFLLKASSDVMTFLRRRQPLEIKGGLTESVAVKLWCQKTISIGDITSAGVRLNMSVLQNEVVEGRIKFANVPETKDKPGAQVLEMGIGALKQPLVRFRLRSDIYLLRNDLVSPVTTPDTQTTMNYCTGENFEKWMGQKMCVDGFYQAVKFSADTAFPPLSGPVHLDVIARPTDLKLEEYLARFTLTRQQQEKGQRGMVVVWKMDCSAEGEMKRHFNVSLAVNMATKELRLNASVPEIDLSYDLDVGTTYGTDGSASDHGVSSILALGPNVLHSFIMQFKDSREEKSMVHPKTGKEKNFTASDQLLRFNASAPGLSLELFTSSSSGKSPGHFSQSIVFRYYCEPHLGLFYMLHPRPELAAKNGHVSEFSFRNDAQLNGSSLEDMSGKTQADVWQALDTMVILIPGHNVTLLNKMAANYSFAHRDTDIFWTHGLGTPNETLDVIHMDAKVTNTSTAGYSSYQYSMDLDHLNKYQIRLDGSLGGPRHDLDLFTKVAFKAKSRTEQQRQKRSLKGFLNRLKSAEDAVAETVVSVEEAVLRRGAELTESFVSWLSGESSANKTLPAVPGDKTMAAPGIPNSSEVRSIPDGASVNTVPKATDGVSERKTAMGPLLKLFARPEWTMDFEANFKLKPIMGKEPGVPMGYECGWDLNVTLPDLNKRLLASNGTLLRQKGWSGDIAGRVSTDVFNLTLDFEWQQRLGREWPLYFHQHKWKLVEFPKHRFDRSFSLKLDHERHESFTYAVDLVSPRTNLSHTITYRVQSPIHTAIRANMTMHNNHPPFDISYNESSDLTPKGLTTFVDLNSTWMDLDLKIDSDLSMPGVILFHQHINMLGKGPFLNGSRQVDFDLKLNPRDRSAPPTMTLVFINGTGHRKNVQGQLLGKDHVLFVFSTGEPQVKENKTHLKWNIHVPEPRVLQHRLVWDPKMSRHMIGAVRHFLFAGAHSLRHFGQVMAGNVHKNISDMGIPFTNMTVSSAIDRVVQGQMKRVAMTGLDPRANVPLSVKVMKGGLKIAEGLQTAWTKSSPGKAVRAMGVPKLVSGTIRISTSVPHLLLEEQLFFAHQYAKFTLHPRIHEIAAKGEMTFSHPIPVVWDSFLSRPRSTMFMRQIRRRAYLRTIGSRADLPFMAIVSDGKIQTFDGTTFDATVRGKNGCTYLLATDFVHGNHSLLMTSDNITMVTPTANVAIGWNGVVAINDSHKVVSELPSTLKTDPSFVTLTDGLLAVNVPGQLRMTYDLSSRIYVIETAMHVHNRSLGLLGTTSRDPGDDFRLPDGKIASDPFVFQRAYELSQNRKCQNGMPVTSGLGCLPEIEEFCKKLFAQPDSLLADCFPVINPSHFLELCQRRACSAIPPKKENACPVVQTYLKLCTSRAEVKLNTEALSKMCDDCQSASTNELDVVVGLAQSEKGLAATDIADVIRNLAAQLEKADARFGLVHSDGRAAHVQLFNGELFVTAREIESVPRKELADDGVTRSLEALVRTAAQYPFRPHARRLLVLIVDDQFRASSEVELEDLQKLLFDKDISLVLVADDKQMDKQRVLAATWDQRVLCKNCDKDDISLPETKVGELAQMTHGLWLSVDSVARGRPGQMRRLMRTFKHIAGQPSPRCAKGGA